MESPKLSNISLEGDGQTDQEAKEALAKAEARIAELEASLQKANKTSRDQYELAVGALQTQVVSLLLYFSQA